MIEIPELVKVAKLVEQLRSEMYAHIEKEEQVLFPFISQMDQDSIVSYPPAHACFRSVANPIFMMEQEHESAGHIMRELIRSHQSLRDTFVGMCDAYRSLFRAT